MRQLLTTKEVAHILRLQPDTVAKWRLQEKGPPWFKVEGKVFYDGDKLEVWIKQQEEGTER